MMRMHRGKKFLFMAPLVLVGLVLFTFIGGESVRLLWNWLAPSIFGWREITFWEAIGLLALCRILFGGFGRHGGYRSRSYSPENRERFRHAVRRRFGMDPSPSVNEPSDLNPPHL